MRKEWVFVSLYLMKKTISFKITREGKYYIASAIGYFIVTQGKTLDELFSHIKEATELYFEDEKKPSSKKSLYSISLDLPLHA